jgi:methionyl aminopeptidase
LSLCKRFKDSKICSWVEERNPTFDIMDISLDFVPQSNLHSIMIHLKTKAEIDFLRISGKLASEILQALKNEVAPYVTTGELNELAGKLIRERNGKPAPPEVGFPGNICVSVNNQVVHGIPGKRVLKTGDIVSIDVTAAFDGYYGDIAGTFPVGEISEKTQELLVVTKQSLYEGISKAINGNRLGDVSNAIQTYAEKHGFSVVRNFVGHGIGKSMWEEPQVPNFGFADRGVKLRNGMVLAIEPMVNIGGYDVKVLDDKWTAVTQDGSLSAHFEHTVAILEDGPEILTSFE